MKKGTNDCKILDAEVHQSARASQFAKVSDEDAGTYLFQESLTTDEEMKAANTFPESWATYQRPGMGMKSECVIRRSWVEDREEETGEKDKGNFDILGGKSEGKDPSLSGSRKDLG